MCEKLWEGKIMEHVQGTCLGTEMVIIRNALTLMVLFLFFIPAQLTFKRQFPWTEIFLV